MNDKLILSVGIPAYNEENNILPLIKQVLLQHEDVFTLLEIVVISDGSTDATVSQAKSIQDTRINVISNKNRIGLASTQNLLIENTKGEVLVLLDADTIIKSEWFLSKLLEPFRQQSNIGIVGAKVSPLPAVNFFQKIINTSVSLKQEIYEEINNKDTIYLCHGRARAFSRKFVKDLHFPSTPGEDAYSYIQCKTGGYKFVFAPQAEIFYQSPDNIKDHLRQSKRFFKSKKLLDDAYGQSKSSYYEIPKSLLFRKTVKYVATHPILVSLYVIIYTIARVSSLWYKTSVLWDVSLSSKVINK